MPGFSLGGPVLASGDFDADGFADLVVSSPGSEDIKGALVVLRGSARGLTARGMLRLSRDTPGVSGKGFVDDFFGAGLAVGDVTGDGIDDLALTSQEDPGNGSLYVFAGSTKGLQIAGHTYLLSDAVFGRWKLSRRQRHGADRGRPRPGRLRRPRRGLARHLPSPAEVGRLRGGRRAAGLGERTGGNRCLHLGSRHTRRPWPHAIDRQVRLDDRRRRPGRRWLC